MKSYYTDILAFENNGQHLPFVLDLQRFANPEDEGRTEEPTEKKIRDARNKGQIAKTDELPQSLVVILALLFLLFMGKWCYGRIMDITRYFLSNFGSFSITESTLRAVSFGLVIEMSKILLPLFGICMIGGVLGNIIQVGLQFSAHPIKPDFSKIKFSPNDMIQKLLISKRVAMNLFKSLFKIGVIAFSSYLIISADFVTLISSPDLTVAEAFSSVSFIAFKIIIVSAIMLLGLAIPDYIFQRKELIESLKMSKQEIKEEQKESMGDPNVRARMREMQREILTRNMIRDVPRADVVVTNPTHFSIALQWDQATMPAPTVIAKGVDSMALRIREVAKSNGVMMIENRPLAQTLYRDVEVGMQIPEKLFQAVVEIYFMLYREGKLKQVI